MSQRALLLFLALVSFSSVGSATTYYVDSVNGNDTNAGTSATAPWQTVSKVNGTHFSPGDSVLFMCGDVWRDRPLIPSSSGAAGSPITYDAYGTGANPQINAASIVPNWTNVSGYVWSAPVSTPPSEVARNKARAQPVASRAALVQNYQWYWASNTLYVYSSTDPTGDGSMWESARWATCIAIQSNQSHLVIQNFDLYYSNGNGDPQIAVSPTSNVTDITFNNINSYLAYSWAISINNATASASNITFNKVNISSCCIQSGGIAGVATGNYGVTNNPTTNLTWNGGHISYSGVDINAGVIVPALGMNADNCTKCTFTNVQIDHSGSSAFGIENGSNGVAITGGSWHDDGQAAAGDRDELAIGDIGVGSSNITVNSVDMYNDLNGQDAIEISRSSQGDVMSNVTISHCQIHNNAGRGFHIDGAHTGIVFEYNLVYGNQGYGYFSNLDASGNPSVLVYGNVFWGNGSASNPANWEIGAAGGTTAMNNIVGQANGASSGSGSEIIVSTGCWLGASDYNDWYHSVGGKFMSYQGTAYSFAGWQKATVQDAHSLSVNPQFVSSSPGGPNDFKLLPTSPLIGAGTNLGAAYEYGLDMQSANFPYALFNQNSSANGWDIGPFVFRQSFILVVK